MWYKISCLLLVVLSLLPRGNSKPVHFLRSYPVARVLPLIIVNKTGEWATPTMQIDNRTWLTAKIVEKDLVCYYIPVVVPSHLQTKSWIGVQWQCSNSFPRWSTTRRIFSIILLLTIMQKSDEVSTLHFEISHHAVYSVLLCNCHMFQRYLVIYECPSSH